MFVDYYAVLQVVPTADPEVIEKAYRALIFKHHPDKGGDSTAAELINRAHDVLCDPEARALYNLEWGQRAAGSVGPEDPSAGREREFSRAYSDVMHVRSAGVGGSVPDAYVNDSPAELSKIPEAVRRAYLDWRERPSFENWQSFLGAILAWEAVAGPACVGRGAVRTWCNRANGLPGFAEVADKVEALVPLTIAEVKFPQRLESGYATWLQRRRAAATEPAGWLNRPAREADSAGHDFVTLAWTFAADCQRVRGMPKWQVANLLCDHYPEARYLGGFGALMQHLEL